MAKTTIGWTATVLPDGTVRPGYTYNPWYGCEHKVDDGVVDPNCIDCYAEARMDKWLHKAKWGKGQERIRATQATRNKPDSWNEKARKDGVRDKVFTLSLGDWLDDAVPLEWLAELLCIIALTPNLNWLLLTKRIENWRPRLEQIRNTKFDEVLASYAPAIANTWLLGVAPHNIWMGITCGTQRTADKRIPLLLDIPAKIRFLSMEPLPELVNVQRYLPQCSGSNCQFQGTRIAVDEFGKVKPKEPCIHWVILGGKSGSKDPTHLEHLFHVVDQTQNSPVYTFVKQLGSHPHLNGQPLKLKDKKGEDINEFPPDLQIQEIPA